MANSVLEAVRSGHKAGLCLLPTRDDGSKAPALGSWSAYQTTRPTIAEMRAFDFAHRSGFGVVAGAVSGHVDPWDFDCRATYDAFVQAAHQCGLRELVETIRGRFEIETPGGGRRWLVRYPATEAFQDVVLARRPGRTGEK